MTDADVQILQIDTQNRKISSVKCYLGQQKRAFTCVAISDDDEHLYCGTKTGDIMEFQVQSTNFKRIAPVKVLFAQGVKTLKTLLNGDLCVGAGDGTLAKLDIQTLQIKTATQVLGGITSIAFTSDFSFFFCGTNQCNIYWVDSSTLCPE